MSDFSGWEEVKEWLENPEDNYQTVTYHSWTWSGLYMSCHSDSEYGPCCQYDYESVEDAVQAIKDYSNNRLNLVEKNDRL